MMKWFWVFLVPGFVWAKKVEVPMESSPKEKLVPFFSKEKVEEIAPKKDHFMALHLGTMVESVSYRWGTRDRSYGVGKNTLGVTYRVGEWSGSMDLLARMDFISFRVNGDDALKLSLLPMIIFPEASSRFPLYFGAGIGPGVFFHQISDGSSISLDYQLIAGFRMFNVVREAGFFLETGLKNHFHLLSEGQFNGTFIAVGSLFNF